MAFIGAAGIPNRYGGFESFLEHCAPGLVAFGNPVYVTCDAHLYESHTEYYRGVKRVFVRVPANGLWSPIHDLLAFRMVFSACKYIVVLGVSGGIWFPIFQVICRIKGKRLIVNVDGVEWRRGKHGSLRRLLLRTFDWAAQTFSDKVIYDNPALAQYLTKRALKKSVCIGYSGDHVVRLNGKIRNEPGTALTICRIEPENNLEMLITGALGSRVSRYIIVGNWSNSKYGRELRKQYRNNSRIEMRDPVYDPISLAELRERCSFYLHGHSVGGTNPSLVEMIFYDCRLLCFDVEFNRYTAKDCAMYFDSARTLTALIDRVYAENSTTSTARIALRRDYAARVIVERYIAALTDE